MTDEEITKLALKLNESLATKEDLNRFATKEDLKNLATKGDLKNLEIKLDKRVEKLESKMDELNSKTDTILEFAEAIEETTANHEKRLTKIESMPTIAHQIKE